MSGKRVKRGTWMTLEFTIAKAQEAMRKEGWPALPSNHVLSDNGYRSLSAAIIKYHGGFPAFRTTLGQENPYGRRKDLDYTIQQARGAMQEQGWTALPSERVLDEKGYCSLARAISIYHGGLMKFRAILGQGNPMGRWKSIDYTIQQAQQAMKEQGWTTLPCAHKLADNGYSSLSAAIIKYHDGFPAFRALLGQSSKNVPHGLWKQQSYAIEQARKAMRAQGWTALPGANTLADEGYSSLSDAIYLYHGGFASFRAALGQENPYGRWKDLDYAIRQARQAMKEQGWTILPGTRVLHKKKYSNLAHAITRHHDGVQAFRKLLGQENPYGRWKDLDYAIRQARKAMKEHGWTTLPGSDMLNGKGYSSLAYAISRYHSGFPAFRELLAKAQGQPTHKEHLENLLHNYLDRPDQDDNAAGCRVPA
jgi:hypothetical protein